MSDHKGLVFLKLQESNRMQKLPRRSINLWNSHKLMKHSGVKSLRGKNNIPWHVNLNNLSSLNRHFSPFPKLKFMSRKIVKDWSSGNMPEEWKRTVPRDKRRKQWTFSLWTGIPELPSYNHLFQFDGKYGSGGLGIFNGGCAWASRVTGVVSRFVSTVFSHGRSPVTSCCTLQCPCSDGVPNLILNQYHDVAKLIMHS